ncbi:MAG: septation protein SepH [Actinomycetaceae bacterium]|nr:septation protein SepH [Actinomycetaceae bacterium]
MIELELLGAHGDGSQLVFTDKDGERYLITIDDALKAAIRRGEMKLESIPQSGASLSPREIQQLLRAGMPAADIAVNYNVEIERINRFLSPVIAERNYIVNSALDSPVGGESDAPRLGELVVDRLATRSVDPHTLTWTALREGTNPWELHLTFIQAAKEYRASWEVTNRGNLIRALDEEARWLTETTTPATPTNVTAFPEAAQMSNTPGEPATGDDIDKILEDLSAQRGKRRTPKEGDQPAKSPLLAFPSPKQAKKPEPEAEPEKVEPRVSEDKDSLPGFETLQVEEPEKKTSRTSKRRSVPSWDEIVFGTRGD